MLRCGRSPPVVFDVDFSVPAAITRSGRHSRALFSPIRLTTSRSHHPRRFAAVFGCQRHHRCRRGIRRMRQCGKDRPVSAGRTVCRPAPPRASWEVTEMLRDSGSYCRTTPRATTRHGARVRSQRPTRPAAPDHDHTLPGAAAAEAVPVSDGRCSCGGPASVVRASETFSTVCLY